MSKGVSFVLPLHERLSRVPVSLLPQQLQGKEGIPSGSADEVLGTNLALSHSSPRSQTGNIYLNFLTHNVAGPMVPLKEVLDLFLIQNHGQHLKDMKLALKILLQTTALLQRHWLCRSLILEHRPRVKF